MIQTIKKLPVVVDVVLPQGRWGTSEAGRWSLCGDDDDEDRRRHLLAEEDPGGCGRGEESGATDAAPVGTPAYSHAQMCTHTHDVETPLPLTPPLLKQNITEVYSSLLRSCTDLSVTS
jgi:hypothetical protein